MQKTNTVLVVTASTSFVLGCALTYALLFRQAAHWMETQPTLILSEQTNVLKHLRAGKEEQIIRTLESVIWLQISMHAKQLDEGIFPLERLRSDITYHCKINAESSNAPAERNQWCAAVQFKWPRPRSGDA